MKFRNLMTSCGAVLMVSFAGAGLWATSAAPALAGSKFQQTNLVSDQPAVAQFQDPSLVNAWGISGSPTGSPFWISDNGTGVSTLYSVPGSGPPSVTKNMLTVTIPPASGMPGDTSAPTGQVFNNTSGFNLKNGNGNPALFLFASEDGAISGWNGGTNAVIEVNNDKNANPFLNAVYKGLAISGSPTSEGTLYAANFRSGYVEMYDSNFSFLGQFTDPTLPGGYAPFNDQVIGSKLYVTYALQDNDKHDDVAGAGHGFVDVFNLDGAFDERLVSQGPLDSPWGLSLAPGGFGSFGNDLLVGNFGDGRINAFDPVTGAFEGTLDGTDGNPLSIDGLWGLKFGNGGKGGSLNTLYFTAGPDGEAHGLFGALTAVPEPSTWAMLALGFGGLGFAGYRRSRRTDAKAVFA